MNKRVLYLFVLLVFAASFVAGCAPAATPTPQVVKETVSVKETVQVQVTSVVVQTQQVLITPTPAPEKKLKVFGAYATPIEEPWDGVIHTALKAAQDAGKITYEYTENIGYSGDMERILREVATTKQPDIIFGDAFGNEEAVRRVAKDFPKIAFVFGSGGGPSEPNVSVFDNWIHEPAYLCGMLAAGMSKTHVVGIVAAMPIPEVDRLINAFIAGAKSIDPNTKILVNFINSFFDPAAAKEAALAQIDAKADVLYAERDGVIDAAKGKGLYVFGNMSDQNAQAPDLVLTGPVWNMGPTIDYVLNQVKDGAYTAQDLKDFSMASKGGATLAPFHGLDSKIPADLLKKVQDMQSQIQSGLFRVDVNEGQPQAVN
jgi:basic membrane lipoprotein Med (substrate-binding protein (PBP1-ABC) superfamily)